MPPRRAGCHRQGLDGSDLGRPSAGEVRRHLADQQHGSATAATGGQTPAWTSKVPGQQTLLPHGAGKHAGQPEARPDADEGAQQGHRERLPRAAGGAPAAAGAPTARRRAISRCRCCTNRVIMPASTRAATKRAMPPSEPLIAIRRMLGVGGVQELGLARDRRRSAPRAPCPGPRSMRGGDLVDVGAVGDASPPAGRPGRRAVEARERRRRRRRPPTARQRTGRRPGWRPR